MAVVSERWEVTGSAPTSEVPSVKSEEILRPPALNPVVSKVIPFSPDVLSFDRSQHACVEIKRNEELFGLLMNFLVQHGVLMEEDSTSFRMSRAEKGGSKPSKPGQNVPEEGLDLETISISLGLGLFRFRHEGKEFKVLHQQIGDPVGGDCSPTVYSNLVLFREGMGYAAMAEIRAFLAWVVAEAEKTAKNTFQVWRWHIKYKFWMRITRVRGRPVSSVVLPKGTADMLVDDISEFLSEETAQFYMEKGIPYKRSYLLYGVPGAGKTSMIQALAGKFGRNLCYLCPTHPELTDDALKSAIERVPQNSMLVLEDIDALFSKDRVKKVDQSPLTFSGLLNALDGVGNPEGLILFLTTNFKDQLDAALIRDGRVDVRVHFDWCGPDQMVQMFENFYPSQNATAASSGEAGLDAEILALEAKIAALRTAKEAGGDAAGAAKENVAADISGAAFRDALLAVLGDRKLNTAQLQGYFVSRRKKSAAEVIAEVQAIPDAIDQRLKEEEEKEEKQEKENKPETASQDEQGDASKNSSNSKGEQGDASKNSSNSKAADKKRKLKANKSGAGL